MVAAALDVGGAPVSSSAIRSSIAHGDLEPAKRLLGPGPYGFHGTVVPGQQRGRALGLPNDEHLSCASPRKLLPPEGYTRFARTRRAVRLAGMMNLGARPTFAEFDRTLEVHLFDATGDWYGEAVTVRASFGVFVTRLDFDSVGRLVAQFGRKTPATRGSR